MARRNILVVGATGKQGGATVRHLLAPKPGPAPATDPDPSPTTNEDVYVYALTRNPESAAAKNLVASVRQLHGDDAASKVELVKGDLTDANGIRATFERIATTDGGIWGVFVAQQFPGLGKKDDGERDRGIMLANLALEFNVAAFIYSTTLQPAARNEDINEYSRTAKRAIELHCQSLTERGLNWIILQPGFFMENFEGTMGRVAVTFFDAGLKKETTISVIASDDIGRVAAAVFADHQRYLHKTIGLTSGPLTMDEIKAAYQRGTGKPMPTIPVPAFVVRLLLWLNAASRGVIGDIETHQKARDTGQFEHFDEEVQLGQSIVNLLSFEEWARRADAAASATAASENASGWNQLSIFKLLTGRS
ncbi:hypothetical protein QBC39DRAFT_92973 [Podospora conica]|nr:hypothetical protein QBC39DRAFT_92973 [Schizothecium conicum]